MHSIEKWLKSFQDKKMIWNLPEQKFAEINNNNC